MKSSTLSWLYPFQSLSIDLGPFESFLLLLTSRYTVFNETYLPKERDVKGLLFLRKIHCWDYESDDTVTVKKLKLTLKQKVVDHSDDTKYIKLWNK